MANIRINALPSDASPTQADVLPIDGSTTRKATIKQVAEIGRPAASQAEAETGTDPTKAMTPLTVKQSIAAEVGNTIASKAQGDKADSAMQPATYDPQAIGGDAFARANHTGTQSADTITDGITNKAYTGTEQTKLAGIEAGADVTDATNVAAAGAVMSTATDASSFGFVLDEDDMASDSDKKLPTQQSVKARIREIGGDAVSVLDFGAIGDGMTDDSVAFQDAVDSGATRIIVPGGKTYVINTEPIGTDRTIFWDIDPTASIIGDANVFHGFPYTRSNFGQRAAGPFLHGYKPTDNAPAGGGISLLTLDMIATDADEARSSVAAYFGAVGSSPNAGANVWAVNALVAAESGAAGTYQCIEVDVNSASTAATTKGISISGGGTADTDVGLEVARLANKWKYGVHILNSAIGAQIDMVSGGTGLLVKSLTALPSSSAGTAIAARQSENGKDILFLQRETDTSPSGYFLRMLNAANSSNILIVDTIGNLTTVGILSGAIAKAGELRATGSRSTVGAGAVSIGGAVGASAALPAGDPAGYLLINVAGTDRRVPFYT